MAEQWLTNNKICSCGVKVNTGSGSLCARIPSGDTPPISSKFGLADRDVEESNYMRVEVDRLGQAPLRAVLGNRGQRPFDIDYARFMHVVSVSSANCKVLWRAGVIRSRGVIIGHSTTRGLMFTVVYSKPTGYWSTICCISPGGCGHTVRL